MVGKWQLIMTTNPFLRIEETCWRKTLLDFNECFVESWDMTSNKKYVKGKELLIADSLSRSQTTNQNRSKIEEEIETRRLVHEDQSSKSHLAEIAVCNPAPHIDGLEIKQTKRSCCWYLCDPNYIWSEQVSLWPQLWSEHAVTFVSPIMKWAGIFVSLITNLEHIFVNLIIR